MAARQVDAVTELQSSFQVLMKNWILALPTAVVALLSSVFFFFVVAGMLASFAGASMLGGSHPSGAAGLLAAGGVTFIIGCVVLVLLSLLANAMVVGASERVWHGEPPDLSGGISRALGKLGPLVVLFIIAIIIGIVCGLLAILAGLGILIGLVLAFFFMYTLPGIIIGNQGAMEALGTSSRLVRANLGPSLVAFLGIVVVSVIGQIIVVVLSHIPVINFIAGFVVGGATAAYAALVTVRMYDLLRAPIAPATPVTTATPTI